VREREPRRRGRGKIAFNSLGAFPKALTCLPRRAHFPRHPIPTPYLYNNIGMFPKGTGVVVAHGFKVDWYNKTMYRLGMDSKADPYNKGPYSRDLYNIGPADSIRKHSAETTTPH
jgi:hypothetical protein